MYWVAEDNSLFTSFAAKQAGMRPVFYTSSLVNGMGD